MSSRNDRLTEQLVIAAKYGNYDAIRTLVEEGASVNGFPTDNVEDIPLLSALYEIIHKVDYVCFGDQSKRNYALTFRALFECGADIGVIKDFDWIELISYVFPLEVFVLFLKYGAKCTELTIKPKISHLLSFYRTIRYNGGECAVGFYAKLLCAISFGSVKELLMLARDDFSGKKNYLKFAQSEPCDLTVEFVFTITFIVELF